MKAKVHTAPSSSATDTSAGSLSSACASAAQQRKKVAWPTWKERRSASSDRSLRTYWRA